jgi:hypothetical protein
MPLLEVCKECYKKHFPVYENMEIKVSRELHKCYGCGKFKQVVREIWSNSRLVDIN